MSEADAGLRQLARALELVQQHRVANAGTDAELLRRHPDLRELLEPLLAEVPDEAVEGAASVVLGDYRLEREIGRGGMGIVHEAVQVSLGRRVALKVLPDHRAANPTALARFHREAGLLARLQHDHLVPVYASGDVDGQHFFAMELVDGRSLAAVLQQLAAADAAALDGSALAAGLAAALGDGEAGAELRGRSHVEAALGCVLPIAEALAHCHAHGIVHRDVKPANILLRRDGTPLLSDFGLARDLETPGLTRTGDWAGTPHYVAPEQIEARPGELDGRVDVFALGVTLYELLTLRRPFDGPTTEAVIARVLRGQPVAPRSLGLRLPDDLLAVLDRAMQKAPAERYATMAAFAADLRALLELRPVSVTRPGICTRIRRYARREPLKATLAALLATGGPVLVGLGGYLLWQQPRIAAAARQERRDRVEDLLEEAYLELGEGSLRIALARLRAADEQWPDLPETTVGLVLAHELAGHSQEAKAARQRLAGLHDESYAELSGLAADSRTAVTKAFPIRPTLDRTAPKTALGYYVRGMRWLAFAHDSGDRSAYVEAATALRQAIDRAPGARALYHCQYLHTLSHLGDAEAIRSFVRVALDLWPDSPLVRYWVGFALEDIEPERAMQLQRDVLEARPDLLLPHAVIARVFERQQRFEDAAECYRTILAAETDQPTALIGLARVLSHLDAADETLAIADRAVAVAANAHAAWIGRAAALVALGRTDEALASAERAVKLTEVDPECHLMLARVRLAQGQPEAALAATRRAAELDPGDTEPHLLASFANDALGRPAAAAASLEQVVARDPQRALAWYDLAWRRAASGDDEGAEAAIERSLQRGGERADVQYLVGNWRKQHGDDAAAARHYLRAIELDHDAGPARVNLAAIRWRQGDMAGCIRLYREAIAAAPDLDNASEGLARALEVEGRADESIAERRRWAEAHPDAVGAWLQLGAALVRLQGAAGCEAALAAVERAAALTETPRADVVYWRAEVLRVRGDDAASLRSLYVQARELPDCSADLGEAIAKRLAKLGR